MYLERVDAVRYGELVDVALGGLGPGLNLVLGRNEAGKSTLTSLIRHVLFGFPRGRTSERLYQPPSGDLRVGRLTFVDDGSSWVVERTEGVRGGEVVVAGPNGRSPGDDFLEALVRGVSDTVYRTVFGFSLEELSDLGSLNDIQSRLYATTAGLEVNPHDALSTLTASAEEIWTARGRTRKLNTLNSELRELRQERRRIEEAAESFRQDRERRQQLIVELDSAEGALRTARREAERLDALLGEARRLEEKIREDETTVENLRLEAEECRLEYSTISINRDLLANEEAIERLGVRCELFRSEAEELRRDEDKLKEIKADLRRRVAGMGEGWSPEAIAAVRLDLDVENRLHELESRIAAARRETEDAARRAAEARSEHEEALRVARERSAALGLGEDDLVPEVVGVRLETVDRLLKLSSATRTERWPWIPGAAAGAVAVILLVLGLVLNDRPLAYAAVLPGALAIGLLVRSWSLTKRVPVEVETLLPVIECTELPTPAELVEMRSGLDDCHRSWETADTLGRTAVARETAAATSKAAHDEAWREWMNWLNEQGLSTPSSEPESVRRVLRLLRELTTRTDAQKELEAQIERRRDAAEAFANEARAVGVGEGRPADQMTFEEVAHGVRSLLAKMVTARKALERRTQLETSEAKARERETAARARLDAAREDLGRILNRAGVADADLADLEAAVVVAKQRVGELADERDVLLERRATLDGRLQIGAQESSSARLRLQEAGLVERIRDAVESYAEAMVAARLLEESLEIYEAEKQPQVIQRSQEVFSALTGGRYTRVATPLGVFQPVVGSHGTTGKPPEQLSRATAEQLFLALRLSYVENLADAHPALPVLMDDVLVNFDDERREAAVRVIADFAEHRQVVFFTCHAATSDAITTAAPASTVIELG
jgi:uncharacterized protein YhaN